MVPSLASHPGQKRAKAEKNRKHRKKLNRENRFTIWNSFWEEQYESRLKWLASCVRLAPVNRQTVEFTEQKFKKNESRLYFLPKVNAPDVKYLPSSLTIQFMFDDFVKKNLDVTISVESYRCILKTINISLRMPVSDACPTYERYSERNNDDDVNDEDPDASENDSPNKRVYGFDLQKVILNALRMPVSDACPTYERYSERNNDDDVNDEDPGQELDSLWKDEWLLHIDMARKATHKYQEDASENDSPNKRVNWTSNKRACTKKVKLPHLNAIVEAEFRKRSRNMFYRTSFDSDEMLLSDFLQKSFNHTKIQDPDSIPRGISKEKRRPLWKNYTP
ncbi:hypothetical protein QYM36_011208 [Artemia franciscana]|uniref:Uncharacterized protein n=1 Tax=Artemia franciscana TaxID=6661 RepID=A0AA88L4B8_ARTSF|nr:hypothetical protein QYM36_011208 [Artemia franciscana]